MFLGIKKIDDYLHIPAKVLNPATGALTQPTVLTYSIYEAGNATGLDEAVDMQPASPFDSVTGVYLVARQLTAAAGFEAGKDYQVWVTWTVSGITLGEWHAFQIQPTVALAADQAVNVTKIAGAAVNAAAAQVGVNVVNWKGEAAAAMTGDAYARLGAPAGVSVSADVAAVKAETAAIVADTGTDGVVVAAASKTGYTLHTDYDAAKTAAQAGDAMTLVNDAITAAKFDESTAFPVKAADAGATILARAGDKMDLVDAPNATAIAAAQTGLATAVDLATVDGIVDAIKVVTDAITGSDVSAVLAATVPGTSMTVATMLTAILSK